MGNRKLIVIDNLGLSQVSVSLNQQDPYQVIYLSIQGLMEVRGHITQNPSLCAKACGGDTEPLGSQHSWATRCSGPHLFKQQAASTLQFPNPLLVKPQFRSIRIRKPKASSL